jgi:hypothetical protein
MLGLPLGVGLVLAIGLDSSDPAHQFADRDGEERRG